MSARRQMARRKVDYEERLDAYIKFGSPRRTWRLTVSTLVPPRFSVVGDPPIERNWPSAAEQRVMHLLLAQTMLNKLKLAANPYSPDGFDVGTDTGPSRNFVEMTIAQLVIALQLPTPRLTTPLFDQITSLLGAVERELKPGPALSGALPLLALRK